MITKSAKKPVDEGHERPSHACGSGSALPGVCARHLPILRDCEGLPARGRRNPRRSGSRQLAFTFAVR